MKVVIGLAILLLLTLARGPLKHLIPGTRPVAAPTVTPVPGSAPAVLRPGGLADAASRDASDAPAPPAYTASEMRDPLKSALPEGAPVSAGLPSAPASTLAPPPPATVAGTLQLNVTGVWLGGRAPMAIVNNGVYALHDMVAPGARLQAIDAEGITVEYAGQVTRYRLPPIGTQKTAQVPGWR